MLTGQGGKDYSAYCTYSNVGPKTAFKGIVHANSNRGRYKAQIFHPRKLEARQFKGTPSQEEHKTIFSGLKIIGMALSG
jgi:hypothetical protein